MEKIVIPDDNVIEDIYEVFGDKYPLADYLRDLYELSWQNARKINKIIEWKGGLNSKLDLQIYLGTRADAKVAKKSLAKLQKWIMEEKFSERIEKLKRNEEKEH